MKRATDTDTSKGIDPKLHLGVYVLSEVAKIGKWLLEEGSVVVSNAVKELNEIPEKDELLQANITRMAKIGKQAAEFKLDDNEDSVMKLFENMASLAEMMADYESMAENTKLKQTLRRALDNNGYIKLDSELEQKFTALSKDFDKVFTVYLQSLSSNERLKQSKLINWYNDFLDEVNEEKKLEKLSELFDLLN